MLLQGLDKIGFIYSVFIFRQAIQNVFAKNTYNFLNTVKIRFWDLDVCSSMTVIGTATIGTTWYLNLKQTTIKMERNQHSGIVSKMRGPEPIGGEIWIVK